MVAYFCQFPKQTNINDDESINHSTLAKINWMHDIDSRIKVSNFQAKEQNSSKKQNPYQYFSLLKPISREKK